MFEIEGDDSGLLIGRRGETLRALQFLVRFIVSRQLGTRANLMLDVEGYQQRQELVVDPASEGSAIFSARLSAENEIRQYHFDIGLLENLLASLKSSGQSLGSMTRAAEIVPGGQALHSRLQQLRSTSGVSVSGSTVMLTMRTPDHSGRWFSAA